MNTVFALPGGNSCARRVRTSFVTALNLCSAAGAWPPSNLKLSCLKAFRSSSDTTATALAALTPPMLADPYGVNVAASMAARARPPARFTVLIRLVSNRSHRAEFVPTR